MLLAITFIGSVACFSCAAGQYGKVGGFIEPLPEDHPTRYEYANEMVGNAIPPEFHPACEKGFREAANAGALIGAPVEVGQGDSLRQGCRLFTTCVSRLLRLWANRQQGARLLCITGVLSMLALACYLV